MKAILDMDPGIDDAVALLIAVNNPMLDVLGVTSVHGNVDVDTTTNNVLRILDYIGKNVPVAKGASRPLFKRPIHSKHVHGDDGLGNLDLDAKSKCKLESQAFFHDILTTHRKKDVNVLATGPLTNIGLLFDNEPSLARRINKIVLMGGVYGITRNVRGNVSPYAEFNIYCDPEAADIVLNSGIDVDAVVLDVTTRPEYAIGKTALNAISKLKGKCAAVASKMLSYPVSRYKIFHLHDVFALARLLQPDMFETMNCRVTVDKFGKFRGRCVVTVKNGNVNVCSSVKPKFKKFLIDGLK